MKISAKRFPLPYQSLDKDGNFLNVNHSWLELFGYEKKEVISKNFSNFIPLDDVKRFQKRFKQFKKNKQINQIEFLMLHKDGHTISCRIDGKIVVDENNNYTTHCFIYDMTKQKSLEHFYEEIFTHTTYAIAILKACDDGENFTFVDMNSKGLSLQEAKKADIIGKTLSEIFPQKTNKSSLLKLIQKVYKSGEKESKSFFVKTKKTKVVQRNISIIKLPSNQLLLIYNDETELDYIRRLLEKTVASIENIIATTIKGKELCWCNEYGVKVLGYDSFEKLKKEKNCICDFFIEDDKHGYIGANVGELNWLEYTLKNQEKKDVKVKLHVKNQEQIFSLQAHKLNFDKKNRYVIVMQDITSLEKALLESKNYQVQLQEKTRMYEDLFKNAPIAFQSLDTQGNIINVNRKWKQTAGVDENGFRGKHFSEFLSKETAPSLSDNFEKFKNQGYIDDAEYELVNQQDGSLTPIRVYGNLSYYDNGTPEHTNCLLYDLTRERKQEKELKDNFESVMQTFVNILEEKDVYTAGHSKRVAKYSQQIAKLMKLSDKDIDTIFRAGSLHDIGKIVTPEAILLKPSQFDEHEYKLMQEHSASGFNILNQMSSYKTIAKIIRHHHERYDGKGYPDKLEKDEIPLLSRIMTIADAFDAMTTNRVYKGRMSKEDAINELETCSGTQFDPQIMPYAKKYFQSLESIGLTTSIPNDEISRHRFAYFFKDRLTNVYNGAYLDVFLHDNIQTKEYHYAYIVDLHNFHEYNKTHNWEAGNEVLINLAKKLVEKYATQMVFRIHGDKFVILIDMHMNLEKENFELPKSLHVSIQEIDLHVNKILSFDNLLSFIYSK